MELTRLVRASLAVLPAIVTSQVAAAQAAQPCAGRLDCVDVSTFTATVTDFRVSGTDRQKVVTATVRFQNKATRPLILGYVRASGVVTDDRGNHYVGPNSGAVRGMGEISNSGLDATFLLAPNEASDARFEFALFPRGEILGTAYEMELTVREINPLPGDQFRLGREHSLGFKGFGSAAVATAARSRETRAPAGAPTAPPVGAPSALDPCADLPRCYNAGKFVANIATVSSSSRRAASRTLFSTKFTVRIRNLTTEPLVLAYRARSAQLVDDAGHRYENDAGRGADLIGGIGIIHQQEADPQFVLAPGEARDATFDNQLLLDNGQRRGTVLTFDLTLEELEVLPSRQVRSTRAYVVGFRDIRETVADRGRGLLGGLRDAVKIRTNP